MGNRLFWLSFGSALLVTSIAAWISWEFFIQPMNAAVRTANALNEKFQESLGMSPRILANAGVLFSQKSDLECLSLSSAEVRVRELFDGQKPGGGDFSAEASFRADGGFFFREPIQINVRRGGTMADVSLPSIKILRIECDSLVRLEPSDLAWETLNERLQIRINRALERCAKKDLIASGLLKRADNALREKVREIASRAGCEVVFVPAAESQ